MKCALKVLPVLALLTLASCQTDAIDSSASALPAPTFPPEYYFPRGTYSAQLYSGMMSSIGQGTVTIGRIEGFYLLSVRDARGKAYLARVTEDLSECIFPGNIKLPSKEGFARKSGGALGRRIDRVWSTERYMVLVGVTLDDSKHVVYFRDRATNDPLIVAKFEPNNAPEPASGTVTPPAER